MSRSLRALIGKELGDMRPFFWLFVALSGLGAAIDLASGYLDAHALSVSQSSAATVVVGWIFLTIMFAASVARELDSGAVTFAFALPAKRYEVLLAKWLAAVGIVLAFATLEGVKNACLVALSTSSTSLPIAAPVLLADFVLDDVLLGAILASLALLCACLGSLGWLLIVAVSWAYTPYIEPSLALRPFDLVKLAEPTLRGMHVVVPWPQIAGGLALGLVAFAAAMASFGWRARRLLEQQQPSRWWARVTVGLALCLMFVMAIREAPAPEQLPPESGPIEIIETAHFKLRMRSDDAALVQPWLGELERVYTAVTGLLRRELPQPVLLDLSGTGVKRALGTTRFLHINLEPSALVERDEALAVIGHELTHSVIDVSTDGRAQGQRFLHEGLASFVEHSLFRSAEQQRDHLLWAAAVHARKTAPWPAPLLGAAEANDPDVVYPLGHVFFRSVAALGGPEVFAKLLTAQALSEADELSAEDRLRQWLGRAGLAYERVLARYHSELEKAANRDAAVLASFARPRGRYDEATHTVRLEQPLQAGDTLLCRAKLSKTATEVDWLPVRLNDDGSGCELGLRGASDGLWYQLGVAPNGRYELRLYEQWVRVR